MWYLFKYSIICYYKSCYLSIAEEASAVLRIVSHITERHACLHPTKCNPVHYGIILMHTAFDILLNILNHFWSTK